MSTCPKAHSEHVAMPEGVPLRFTAFKNKKQRRPGGHAVFTLSACPNTYGDDNGRGEKSKGKSKPLPAQVKPSSA